MEKRLREEEEELQRRETEKQSKANAQRKAKLEAAQRERESAKVKAREDIKKRAKSRENDHKNRTDKERVHRGRDSSSKQRYENIRKPSEATSRSKKTSSAPKAGWSEGDWDSFFNQWNNEPNTSNAQWWGPHGWQQQQQQQQRQQQPRENRDGSRMTAPRQHVSTTEQCEREDQKWLAFEGVEVVRLKDIPFPNLAYWKQTLGNVNCDESKKCWQKLALRWHPDKFLPKFGAKLAADERNAIETAVKETFQKIQGARLTRHGVRGGCK